MAELELTITEIAAYIGVSERTALRMITEPGPRRRRMQASHVHGNVYRISQQELDDNLTPERRKQLRPHDRRQPDDNLTAIKRLEALERRLSVLEDLLETLLRERHESAVAPPAPSTRPKPPLSEMRVPARQVEAEAHEGGQKEPIPDGWVGAVSFGKRHGIEREASVTEAIRAGRVQAHENDWKEGRATVKYALDASQQRAFCVYFAMRSKLRQCDDDECVCRAFQ